MAAETELPPADDWEERTSRVPRWLIVLAVLALAGVVVSVIVYGYLARPGWIGVSGKKFWDYLELLIVPAALAVGVAWLNWAQRKRERETEVAQQRRELEIQDQRSQDESLQAYLDQLTQLLVTQGDRELIRMRVDEGTREVPNVCGVGGGRSPSGASRCGGLRQGTYEERGDLIDCRRRVLRRAPHRTVRDVHP